MSFIASLTVKAFRDVAHRSTLPVFQTMKMSRKVFLNTYILLLMSIYTAKAVSLNMGIYNGLRYPLSNRFISRTPYQFGRGYPGGYPGNYPPQHGCPICDSSVFSYCSHKLVHDSCCCGDAYYTENSYECQYTDCSYIHANTCQESDLIATCCCEDDYKSLNPFSSRFKFFNKK